MKRNKVTMSECKFHNGQVFFQYARASKCGCRSCLQSHADCKKSDKITIMHKEGVFCKEWTQCTKCSKIKFYTKVLRHFGGYECSKKCPVCNWIPGTQEVYKKEISRLVVELYRLILNKRKLIL
jgi:hypothetical protein